MTIIEQLEKATGPDREIDRAIFEAAMLDGMMKQYDAESWFCSVDCDSYGFNTRGDPAVIWCGALPRFTVSLDAAWLLLAEGAVGFIGNDFELPGNAHVNDTFQNYKGQGANPAIAFCIACLKQRAFDKSAE